MISLLVLAGDPGATRPVPELLAEATPGAHVVSLGAVAGAESSPVDVGAVVAMSPALLRRARDVVGHRVPAVVWVDDVEAAMDIAGARADLVLTGSRRLAATSDTIELVPDGALSVGRIDFMPLLTRERVRLARGLPSTLVVGVDDAASASYARTALALASAAVVGARYLPLALSLGTPAVVTPPTARRFSLGESDIVRVVPVDGTDTAASRLARDPEAASRASTRGRRYAERHFDLAPAAAALRRALRIGAGDFADPDEQVRRRLAEMGVGAAAPTLVRALALAGVPEFEEIR